MNRFQLNLQLIVVALFLTVSYGFGQDVITTELDGKTYFVYPFNVEVTIESEYYSAMKTRRGRSNFQPSYSDYKRDYFEDFGPLMSKKEYKRFGREMRSFSRGMYDERRKYINEKFKVAVRKNPYPLLQQRFQINKDIVPVLDPIPDGEYVQYYESFCFIDAKGVCTEESSFVAGYFSIKDNALHGDALWIDLKGDTLKQGHYTAGLKDGLWKFERRKIDYNIGEEDAKLYVERGYPDLDTTIENITFASGVKNGFYEIFHNSEYPTLQGSYTNGERSGEWITRDITYKKVGYLKVRSRNNDLVTERYTFEANDSLVVNSKWLRINLARTYGSARDQFNFYSKYSIEGPSSTLFEINFKQELELELEEERRDPFGYDDFDYELGLDEEMYFDELDFGYSESPYSSQYYDPILEESKSRGKLMDSLGGKPVYSGTYERYYPNGNKMYSYEFVHGELLKEDTIFWDNGVAHDVITPKADSNQYMRSIYDYDGKLYEELLYDSLGDFIRVHKNYVEVEEILLDGLLALKSTYGSYYFYNKFDTLETELLAPLVIYQSWHMRDSSILYTQQYDPISRKLTNHTNSVTGKKPYREEQTFSEDFESWTGKRTSNLADLEIVKTSSGSLSEWFTPDSIPQKNIGYSYDRFNVANDFRLSRGGNPYSGLVELKFGGKNLTISKKGLKISLPDTKRIGPKISKDVERYLKKGKTKYPMILDFIAVSEEDQPISEYVFSTFFSGALGGFFEVSNDKYGFKYLEGKAKSKASKLERITGMMMDGKAQGLWISYDQYGKKIQEVNFNKGEAHGDAITYANQAASESEYDGYNEFTFLNDSTPEKGVHYISNTRTFVNGSLNGLDTDYNWMGEITAQSSFIDGYRDGLTIERNKLAISKANFKNGSLDGYYQTFLTLPRQDSILLFNLNFQDGLLQGESKAFHTNGKLAKRGFFLNGEPIEDYEGYDSLGFRYHYVKFKYSFPIEEKIWEENELSVQYDFDWKDSIHFVASDITTSQSLEAVLYDMGLGSGMDRPYYGRPSLVNKRGIRYHMTKYFPNDTISREGDLDNSQKVGCWKYFSYDGQLLYEVDYHDSIIELSDSIKFKSKGILSDFDAEGNLVHKSFVIEKFSKYDCAHSDHYEIRQHYTIWEANDSLGRMNGFVRNYYDNGTLQSEGTMKDGLPAGSWKYYDPFGKLNLYGMYVMGKRDGRWLSGDLSKTKYLGDICLNPNMSDLEEEIKYRENLLDITITNYQLGKSLNREYYDINMNRFIEEEDLEGGIDLDGVEEMPEEE